MKKIKTFQPKLSNEYKDILRVNVVERDYIGERVYFLFKKKTVTKLCP